MSKNISKEKYKTAHQMHQKGATNKDIAEHLKVNRNTVSKWLKIPLAQNIDIQNIKLLKQHLNNELRNEIPNLESLKAYTYCIKQLEPKTE